MKYRIGLALLAIVGIGGVFFYFWLFLGLGRQLQSAEYKMALAVLGFSVIPVGAGMVFNRGKLLLTGIAAAGMAVGGIIFLHEADTQSRLTQYNAEIRQENEKILSNALAVLPCKDGSFAALHFGSDVNEASEVKLLSLIHANHEQRRKLLCVVWRPGQVPICRGLESRIREHGLECGNDKFPSLRALQNHFFAVEGP